MKIADKEKEPTMAAADYKGEPALRRYFGPLLSQKLKIAFHQFLLIGLLEEYLKCHILAFILL